MCLQFTKDVVKDTRDLVYAFFMDPFRTPRLADRLEEDLIHHASVLSRCNARNVSFKIAPSEMQSRTNLTSSFVITGRLIYSHVAYYFIHSAGTSRATRGPVHTFSWGPSGRKFLNFAFQNGSLWCAFYFRATVGPPNVVGPGENFLHSSSSRRASRSDMIKYRTVTYIKQAKPDTGQQGSTDTDSFQARREPQRGSGETFSWGPQTFSFSHFPQREKFIIF